jgi:hypothetical protein
VNDTRVNFVRCPISYPPSAQAQESVSQPSICASSFQRCSARTGVPLFCLSLEDVEPDDAVRDLHSVNTVSIACVGAATRFGLFSTGCGTWSNTPFPMHILVRQTQLFRTYADSCRIDEQPHFRNEQGFWLKTPASLLSNAFGRPFHPTFRRSNKAA